MLRCSFAIAFTGIFGVFSDVGLSTLTIRINLFKTANNSKVT